MSSPSTQQTVPRPRPTASTSRKSSDGYAPSLLVFSRFSSSRSPLSASEVAQTRQLAGRQSSFGTSLCWHSRPMLPPSRWDLHEARGVTRLGSQLWIFLFWVFVIRVGCETRHHVLCLPNMRFCAGGRFSSWRVTREESGRRSVGNRRRTPSYFFQLSRPNGGQGCACLSLGLGLVGVDSLDCLPPLFSHMKSDIFVRTSFFLLFEYFFARLLTF